MEQLQTLQEKEISLGDLCEIIIGRTPQRNKLDNFGGSHIWVSIGDMTSKYIDNSKEKLTDKGVKECNPTLIPEGTLLLSFKLSLGKVAITKKPLYTNEAIAALIPKRGMNILYLYYYLKRFNFQPYGRKAVKGLCLNKKILANIKVRWIPTEAQNRIVSILEKAEQLQLWRKESDTLTENYIHNIFLEMFGNPIKNPKHWSIRKLGEVCISIKDGPHVSPNYVEKGIPFISVHNIINGFFDLSDIKYISREDHEMFCKKTKPQKGDVLYSKGGTTGYAKRIDVDFEFSIWVHLALLKFSKELLDPTFLETCLNSSYCRLQAKRLTRGIANKDLVLSQMAKVRIIIPPMDLQRRFSSIVDQIEQIRNYQRQTASEIDSLSKALAQKAFGDELNC